MASSVTDQILAHVPTNEGGRHSREGFHFQDVWTASKLFELVEQQKPDFLVLMEVFQDVAILDSVEAPSVIEVVQVKKQEAGEWTWAKLTGLKAASAAVALLPVAPTANELAKFRKSIVGKLLAEAHGFDLAATGLFVSNAAVRFRPTLAAPNAQHRWPATALATAAIGQLDAVSAAAFPTKPPASKVLYFERTALSPEAPHGDELLVGRVMTLLKRVAPSVAGLATTFADVLVKEIAIRAREPCRGAAAGYDEICRTKGISKADMALKVGQAVNSLDVSQEIVDWLDTLKAAGYDPAVLAAIRRAYLALYTVDRIFCSREQAEPATHAALQWGRTNPRGVATFPEYLAMACAAIEFPKRDTRVGPIAAALIALELENATTQTQSASPAARTQDQG